VGKEENHPRANYRGYEKWLDPMDQSENDEIMGRAGKWSGMQISGRGDSIGGLGWARLVDLRN